MWQSQCAETSFCKPLRLLKEEEQLFSHPEAAAWNECSECHQHHKPGVHQALVSRWPFRRFARYSARYLATSWETKKSESQDILVLQERLKQTVLPTLRFLYMSIIGSVEPMSSRSWASVVPVNTWPFLSNFVWITNSNFRIYELASDFSPSQFNLFHKNCFNDPQV